MTRPLELTGAQFGRLRVLRRVASNKHGNTRWECACECGEIRVVAGVNLTNGHSRSCGCARSGVSVGGALSFDALRQILEYDPATGLFTRRLQCGAARPGSAAGTSNGDCALVNVGGRQYKAHRLAWFYVHGRWPAGCIDHINGDRFDNRLCNLRDVSHAINMQNQKPIERASRSTLLGAHFDKRRRHWYSAITINGRQKYLGRFATAEEAHLAHVMAKRLFHPGHARESELVREALEEQAA